ncbi:MAG: hypothetical protein ACE37K_15155 [Planctomycetota bacterium]
MNRTALTLSFLLLCTGLSAQDPDQQQAPQKAPAEDHKTAAKDQQAPQKEPPFVFEAGTIPLAELVEKCGRYLQWNVLIDENEFAAVVTGGRPRGRKAPKPEADNDQPTGPIVELHLPVVTDKHGCEEMLSSILWRYGFALMPLDEQKDAYEVILRQGQRGRELMMRSRQRTPEQILARPTLRQFVTTVYMLKHASAQQANNSLRPFFASMSSNSFGLVIGNFGNNASLLLSGPQDLVANALRLLQSADQPPQNVDPVTRSRLKKLEDSHEKLLRELERLKQKVDAGQ